MAKTLIIKGASFSENKIETVTFESTVPCTGISLAEQTANVVYGSIYIPVPTVTPSNTTDSIIWSSSNENFTVSNGAVSINGVGQAIITATCGNYSATVTLTSTAEYDVSDFDVADGMYAGYSEGNDYISLMPYTGRFILGRISETGYHALWSDVATREVAMTFCPIIIPEGATSVTINHDATIWLYVDFANLSEECSAGNGGVKIIGHNAIEIGHETYTIAIPSGASGCYFSAPNADKTALEFVFS